MAKGNERKQQEYRRQTDRFVPIANNTVSKQQRKHTTRIYRPSAVNRHLLQSPSRAECSGVSLAVPVERADKERNTPLTGMNAYRNRHAKRKPLDSNVGHIVPLPCVRAAMKQGASTTRLRDVGIKPSPLTGSP